MLFKLTAFYAGDIILNRGSSMNGFSEEEIKQSVEYQWRMQHIKTYFSLWGIVSGIIVVAMFFVAVTGVNWVRPLVDGVAAVLIYLLIFGSFALHDAVKARKFLKNSPK